MPAEIKTVMFPGIKPWRDPDGFSKSTYRIDSKLLDDQAVDTANGTPGPGDDVIKQVGGGFRPAPRTRLSRNISEPFDVAQGERISILIHDSAIPFVVRFSNHLNGIDGKPWLDLSRGAVGLPNSRKASNSAIHKSAKTAPINGVLSGDRARLETKGDVQSPLVSPVILWLPEEASLLNYLGENFKPRCTRWYGDPRAIAWPSSPARSTPRKCTPPAALFL